MKKLLALILALVLVLSLAACGSNDAPATDAPTDAPVETPTDAPSEETDAPAEGETDAPAKPPVIEDTNNNTFAPAEGATAILNNIWALHTEEQKFPALGGDSSNTVDGAPGKMDHTNADSMNYQLHVPAELLSQIDDAAGLFNAMMVNNFGGGVFHVTGDTKAFADSMYAAITSTQWMCGFPEKLEIAVIGEYVIVMYGLNEYIDNFAAHMATAYPEVEVLYNEAIEG